MRDAISANNLVYIPITSEEIVHEELAKGVRAEEQRHVHCYKGA